MMWSHVAITLQGNQLVVMPLQGYIYPGYVLLIIFYSENLVIFNFKLTVALVCCCDRFRLN